MTYTRAAGLILSAALVLAPTGCDKKKPAAIVNLTTVKAVGEFESMAAANRICREMDVHYKGANKTITLTFDNNAVTDDAGHIYDVLPEEFKGVVTMTQTAPGKVAAAHALPSDSENYRDGHGPAKRHGYAVDSPDGKTKLRFTVVKPLEDDSNG